MCAIKPLEIGMKEWSETMGLEDSAKSAHFHATYAWESGSQD